MKKNKARQGVRYGVLDGCSCFIWVTRPEESEEALPLGHLGEEYSWL